MLLLTDQVHGGGGGLLLRVLPIAPVTVPLVVRHDGPTCTIAAAPPAVWLALSTANPGQRHCRKLS